MYIEAILSHMGGWGKLQNDFPKEVNQIKDIIQELRPWHRHPNKIARYYSTKDFDNIFVRQLRSKAWSIDNKISIVVGNNSRYSGINAVKNSIGIEIKFGKFAFVESDLFVKFPLFIKAHKIVLAVIIMPMKKVASSLGFNVSDFDMVSDRIQSLLPLDLRYPFVLLGITDEEVDRVRVVETTSDLDMFLFENVGLSLTEMKLIAEKNNYDFKQTLPPENNTLAKAICAFANLDGGGLLLVGIDNHGNLSGFPRVDIDASQLRISQIVRTSISPPPETSYKIFDVPNDPLNCVLIIKSNRSFKKTLHD